MAQKKQYYVVIHGRRPGLYDRWFGDAGAAEQVDGLTDAVFKGFYTLQEAAEWLHELRAETIPGLAPDVSALLELHREQPQREGPDALLKAGKILIYTDGGAIDNPGRGGYGVVLRYKGHRRELSSGYRWTTNNRMELLACIVGLKTLKRKCSVVVFSDSKYVVNGMTKGWAERWQARGWRLDNDQDVKNADLWRQLVELCHMHDVEFRWMRGHSGQRDNVRCDQLAMIAAERQDLPADIAFQETQ